MAIKPRYINPETGKLKTPKEAGLGPLAQWANVYCQDWEVANQMTARYVRDVITPRRLAEERRKAGDPSARLSDYECGCPLSPVDKKPRCFGHRKTCRFRDRYEAPPRCCNDPVRHDMFKAELIALRERISDGTPEAAALLDKILWWYDRKILAKQRQRD